MDNSIEQMPLTTEKVNQLFLNALYEKRPAPEDEHKAIKVRGITINIGFDPDKLFPMKDQLKKMLLQLDDRFLESKGNGETFLAAYLDRNGHHWAEHNTIQELVMLGIGCGLVEYTTEPIKWREQQGGMPHFRVKDLSWS